MDHASFQEWMANIEQLSSMQFQQAEAAFSGGDRKKWRRRHWQRLRPAWAMTASVGIVVRQGQFREASQEGCGGITGLSHAIT